MLFHSLDPAASELVDRAARPWTLKAEVLPLVSQRFRIGAAVYGLLFLCFTLAAARAAGTLRRGCIRSFEAVSGIALFYLVFISHWGFATGIAVTFRAAVFAYLLAAVLGLTWTGLQSLRSSRATIPIFGAISLLLLAAAALFWAQPRVEYVMVGSTEARIAIAIGYSAYMAEIFRSGIEAVPKGQVEAAQSLGLSRWLAARLIILPQALRIVVPPLGNEFIAMIKDTSLLSILSVRDVTQRMREFQSASFLPFAPFNTAAVLYVVITLACASFLRWIERRYEQRHA